MPPAGNLDVPPGRFGVLASQESLYTPDVEAVVLTFHMRGARVPAGMVSMSPVGVMWYGVDVAGRGHVSSMSSSGRPLGRHEEKYRLLDM